MATKLTSEGLADRLPLLNAKGVCLAAEVDYMRFRNWKFGAVKTLSDEELERIEKVLVQLSPNIDDSCSHALPGFQWRGVETLPTEDGWYLGNFNGAMRCIGFDNGKFDFWGTPSDQRPEDLTHWTELPPIENTKMDKGEQSADNVKSTKD